MTYSRRKTLLLAGATLLATALPALFGGDAFRRYRQFTGLDTPGQFEEYYRPLDLWSEMHACPSAAGLIVAFVVDDLEGELARLEREGVPITMPLTVEPWGERAFQVRDPNRVVVELVDWNG